MVPLFLRDHHGSSDAGGIRKRPNLTRSVGERLAAMGCEPVDLFHHVVAVLHAPGYRRENAGALRMDWPRVPFPVPAEVLKASSDLGRRLVALLDPEAPVPGVTSGALRPELRALAVPHRAGCGMLADDDMALNAGWGYRGQGGAVMPGQGKRIMREYQPEEIPPWPAASPLSCCSAPRSTPTSRRRSAPRSKRAMAGSPMKVKEVIRMLEKDGCFSSKYAAAIGSTSMR